MCDKDLDIFDAEYTIAVSADSSWLTSLVFHEAFQGSQEADSHSRILTSLPLMDQPLVRDLEHDLEKRVRTPYSIEFSRLYSTVVCTRALKINTLKKLGACIFIHVVNRMTAKGGKSLKNNTTLSMTASSPGTLPIDHVPRLLILLSHIGQRRMVVCAAHGF